MRNLAPGTILGSYSIIRLIGRGGMGEVYEANEPGLDRRVALKIIARDKIGSKDEPEILRRFLQEARVLAQVNHPHVVTIHTIDRHVDTHFIAMEYIDGVPFQQLFSVLALSSEQAAPIFLQVLEGMQALHAKNILHRDLKPHNLMLRTDGQVKILDFGIAHRQGDAEEGDKLMGTLPYMAPEVVQGTRANTRSDMWSLGAIFYEMLVGHTLVSAEDRTVIGRRAAANSLVIFPEESLSRIHPQMRLIIARLCEPNPEIRYTDLNEAIEDMKAYIAKQSVAPAFLRALSKIVEGFELIKRQIEPEALNEPAGKRAVTVALVQEVMNNFSSSRSIEMISQTVDVEGELVKVSADSIQARKRMRKQRRRRKQGRRWPVIAASLVVCCVLAAFAYYSLNRTAPKTEAVAKVNEAPAQQPPQAVALASPLGGQALWLKPAETPVFKWSRSAAPGELAIEVATDSAFSKIVFTSSVEGASYQPAQALPEGIYFWRLKRGAVPAAAAQAFSVHNIAPLEVLRPKADAQFTLPARAKTVAVDFNWICKPGANGYRVQVSHTVGFEQIVKEGVLAFCSENRLPLAAGDYYWRARVETPVIENYPWSQVAHFTIEAPTPPPAPVPVPVPVAARHKAPKKIDLVVEKPIAEKPANEKKQIEKPIPEQAMAVPIPVELKKIFIFKFDEESSGRSIASIRMHTAMPQLEWTAIEGARAYRVIISRTADFTTPVFKTVTKTSHLDWTGAMPGRYFWRVSAIGDRESGSSLGAQLDVRIPPPALMSTYSDSPRGFEWDTVPFAERYIVEWDHDKTLAGKKQKLTVKPQIRFDMSNGPVYVRIATANAKGERTSAYSRIARILSLP